VRAALAAALPGFLLAADADGSPYIPLLSFGSFGKWTPGRRGNVDARRAIGVRGQVVVVRLRRRSQAAGERSRRTGRVADGRRRLGADRFDATADWRWSDGSTIARHLRRTGAGVLVVDLAASYRIDRRWSAGLTVLNALDDEHYEAFGGDLLGRRALSTRRFAGG
jgi:outer membrane receptor protein involved in Fe transport